jgi:hypothetical protein
MFNIDFSNPTTQAMIGGVVRSLLIAAGGLGLAGNQITQVSGAIAMLIGVGWSLWSKKATATDAHLTLATAVNVAANNPQNASAVIAAHAANPGDIGAMRQAAKTGSF